MTVFVLSLNGLELFSVYWRCGSCACRICCWMFQEVSQWHAAGSPSLEWSTATYVSVWLLGCFTNISVVLICKFVAGAHHRSVCVRTMSGRLHGTSQWLSSDIRLIGLITAAHASPLFLGYCTKDLRGLHPKDVS